MAITITDVAPLVRYIATEGQTTFTVPFEFIANAHLKVYVNGALTVYSDPPADASEYDTTGENETGGGTIIFGGIGRSAGDIVVIERDMPVERTADIPTSGAFPTASLNVELDSIVAMIQQVEMLLRQRTLRIAVTDGPETMDPLPALADRAGKLLAFDDDGNPATYPAVSPTELEAALEALQDAVEATEAIGAAFLLARANHTGTQTADTISDFAAAVAAILTAAIGTTVQAYSEVLAATTASFTTALLAKLNGIATGATANSTDATLLNRANHTGSQAQSTITNLTTDLAAKAALASPALTGTPTAPTAAVGTNTTQIATTAFVLANGGGGTTYGAIGTYVFGIINNVTSIVANTTYAGSSITPAGMRTGTATIADDSEDSGGALTSRGSGTLSGTWRAMGTVNSNTGVSRARATLFVRIS